ncbi:type I polyketide synthase [Nocardia yamanashiensis]|uniref:type I polyketide synthase n=1 Tax=Nocardia yamanashiensis TaxID=209247 RepID=UPI0022770E71|nr:type I polyketide synthase [Nocardia yamanashiensis]
MAAVNGPAATVVSGDVDACAELLSRCEREKIWARAIPVDYASHSSHVDPLRDSVLGELSGITPRPSAAAAPVFVSTVTGRPMDTAELTPEYWFTNLRQTVRFEEAVAAALDTGCRAFVESSPHPVLTGSIQDSLDAGSVGPTVVVESLRRDDGGLRRFLASAAELFVVGGPVEWSAILAAGNGRWVPLPPYAFHHRRFWSLPQPKGDATDLGVHPVEHPFLGVWVEAPDSGTVVVTGRISLDSLPWLADHTVAGRMVFPGTGFLELVAAVADRLGGAGIRELAVSTPLVLGDYAARIRIVIDAPDLEGGRAVRVYSRPDTGDLDTGPDGHADTWTAHAEAVIARAAVAAAPGPDSATWPPADAVPLEIAEGYEELGRRGYEYGPAFRGLVGLWRVADEVCAEVELRAGDATGFGVHPALLDAVLHAALTAAGWDDRLRLPFAWTGIQVHAVEATRLRARIRVTGDATVSVRATDVTGAPVLSVESLLLRPISTTSFADAAIRATSDGLYRVRWSPAEADVDAAAEPAELTVVRCLSEEPTSDVVDSTHELTARTLDSLRSWLADIRSATTRVVILTRGAVDAGDRAVTDLAGAAVWGLVASAQSEHPGRIVLLDSDSDLDDDAVARVLHRVPAREAQLAVRDGRLLLPRLTRAEIDNVAAAPALAAGTVLISGGTGGLGALVARWLVESHGVRDLVLTSRRGADAPGAAAVADELGAAGAHVRIVACDIADRDAVRNLISRITAEGQLTGVVHAAGVIDDGVIESLTADRLRSVMAPKVDGGWNLHEATSDLELPVFAVFSSIVGTLGMPGQSNYAAGNRFLDGLISYRRALGLSGVSLAWGLWDRATGMTEHLDAAAVGRMRREGVAALSTRQGLALWDAGLVSGQPLLVAARMDRAAMRTAAAEARLSPMLSGFVRDIRRAAAKVAVQDSVDLRDRIARMSADGHYEFVLDLVRTRAAAVLGHDAGAAIDPGRAFRELGFDSLAALQFRNALAAATGLRLRSSLIFDYPTADALTRHLLAESGAELNPAPSQAIPSTTAADEPLVIVGMACRYPGGTDSPSDLWSVVDRGVDVVGEFPLDRGWDVDGLYDPQPGRSGKSYTRAGGFLSGAGDFDPGFFGISPKEALAMDPQQRLLLEVSWEALEDAGIDPHDLKGTATGVYAGLMYHDYPDSDGFGAVASGRVSYALGLEGPAVTVDTACSSSLVALHLAGQAVRSGECELALVGGVTVMATPHMFVEFSRQQGLSADGRCRSFDAAADGTGWAEGVGVLVVERLSRAEELGHRVLAVVAGSAVNQDGASNGLTAPNGPSQQRVIRQALANAGLGIGDVDLVEAHGTGTKLGDPIEAQALLATYGQRAEGDPLWLGSIKSNIGHAQAAAGIAGVIKMVQAMRFGRMPATLHVNEPSPHVDWASGRVELLTEARDWPRNGRPRRAAVSSFGISGTNAHVILEEPPIGTETMAVDQNSPTREHRMLPWILSAKTAASLCDQADRLRSFGASAAASAADVAVSLAGRTLFEHRAVVFGAGTMELLAGLDAVTAQDATAGVVTGRVLPGRTGVVFSGQGSQRLGMGKELAEAFPVFATVLDEVVTELDRWLDRPLREVMWGDDEALLRSTRYAQPALFAIEVATFRLLRSWGVEVGAVMGHSVGEIAAAHVAGALSLADAARLVAVRGRLMQALPEVGAMIAVRARESDIDDLISDGVSVAAVNGPMSVVISGVAAAVEAIAATCAERGHRTTRLRVSHAFHSALMDPMLNEFAAEIAQISVAEPRMPVLSNLTGQVAGPGYAAPEYWVRHVRRPVRFADGIAAMIEAGVTRFVEVGPGAALTAMIGESIDPATAVAVAALRSNQPEPSSLLTAVATLFTAGAVVNWSAVTGETGGRRVSLPPYAFERQRFWRQPLSPKPAPGLGLLVLDHPMLDAVIESPDSRRLVVTGSLSRAAMPWLGDHAVFDRVLMPGTGFVDLVAAVAERIGCAMVRELTITAPLQLTEVPVALRIVVGEPDTGGVRTITIYARPEPETRSAADDIGARPWSAHAEGRIAPPESTPLPVPELRAWPPAGARAVDLDRAYDNLSERGYRYGPVFQGLSRVWRKNADTFVEAILPTGGAAAGFGIHPALLDAVFQAVLLISGHDDEVVLPFAWEGVRLYAEGATTVRARLRAIAPGKVALDVADSAGRAVMSVESLSLRPISAQRLAGALAATAIDGLHHLRWTSVGSSADAGPVPEVRIAEISAPDCLAHLTAADDPQLALVAVNCAMDSENGSVATDSDTAQRAHALTERTLDVIRGWLADDRCAAARLVVLTRGAVDTDGCPVADPAAAAVWGLMASAQSEFPGRITLLDSDTPIDGKTVGRVLARVPAEEPQIALRGDEVLVPRLERVDAAAVVPGTGPWLLDVTETGTLDNVRLLPVVHEPPAAGQVRIETRAVGLNFRDVLIALGMYPGADANIGSEASGVVTQVGPDVTEFRPGDRVMGIFEHRVGSESTTDQRMLVRIPAGLSFAQAAAVPVAFATAYLGLFELARLDARDSVLVHAATGGVGQAAVQLARLRGATVFATASPTKWGVLRTMGVDEAHIGNSRTLDFEQKFREATGGRGVDVVLDALAGEFVDASMRLMPRGGRFLEMGKTDPRDPRVIAARYPGVDYRQFDLLHAGPDRIQGILRELVELFDRGLLQPPPVMQWGVENAAEALRYLSQARHIGKLVLTVPPPVSDGTVLISGGTGGLGALLAQHLVAAHGVRDLVLTSRRGPDTPGVSALVERLRSAGARVRLEACDIADRTAVSELVSRIVASGRLAGVVHAAGVLDDGLFGSLTVERTREVLAPKVDGGWNLHEATTGLELSLFAVFSSIAGVLGTPGQANYAAGNRFLDGLISYRRARGLPGVSLAWGLWDHVTGMTGSLSAGDVARMNRTGLAAMTATEGLALWDAALASGRALVVPACLDHLTLRALAEQQRLPIMLSGLVGASRPKAVSDDRAAESGLLDRLTGMSRDRRYELVLDLVREQAAAVLGHSGSNAIEARKPFEELGFDSLGAVEFRNRMSTVTGLALPTTLMFDYPNADALARFVGDMAANSAAAPSDRISVEESEVRRLLLEIPLSALRETGLLSSLMELAGAPGADIGGGTADADIDGMDAESLIRRALNADLFDEHETAVEEN